MVQRVSESPLIDLHTFCTSAVRAVKAYIRAQNGDLEERIVFLSDEDFKIFLKGGNKAREVLKKYLSAEDAENLDSWEIEEVSGERVLFCRRTLLYRNSICSSYNI